MFLLHKNSIATPINTASTKPATMKRLPRGFGASGFDGIGAGLPLGVGLRVICARLEVGGSNFLSWRRDTLGKPDSKSIQPHSPSMSDNPRTADPIGVAAPLRDLPWTTSPCPQRRHQPRVRLQKAPVAVNRPRHRNSLPSQARSRATTCLTRSDRDRLKTDNKSPIRDPAHGLHCFGHRIICVQRNSASLRPLASSVTTASQTCVVRPRCCAVATQAMLPSLTVPR